jgi:DNA-binding beta-propeller fold protein YncE
MIRAIAIGLCTLAVLLPARGIAQSLKRVGIIDSPGPKGQRFDYLTVDPDDQYLLSAHLGPGLLYVIDVRNNSLVKAIPGVPGITGVEYVPGARKIYTSNWGEESGDE